MRIIFVMGLSCSGKSTYIKNNFKDIKVLDLYDYQKNCLSYSYDEIWDSYMRIKDDLVEAIKNNEDVVLEHTLLKAIRRKIYIDAVKEVTDCPIEIFLIKPSKEVFKERKKSRNCFFNEKNYKDDLSILEVPTIEEGFSKVNVINI